MEALGYQLQSEMANRLNTLSDSLKAPKFVASSLDFFSAGDSLTEEENARRMEIRRFVEKDIVNDIHPYVEEAKFPEYLLPKLKELDILKNYFKAPYGAPHSGVAQGFYIAEMARGDAGVATMVLVQWALAGYTIETLGSEEQKKKYLPKLRSFEWVGGWGLTEPDVGSDASNLETSVEKTPEGKYLINGSKRWIGNGNRDLVVTWARNKANKKVEAYVVENKHVKGLTSEPIKHKLPMRIVQNCHITYNNVEVGEQHKLPKATDFANGTNVILKHSRVGVCWIAVGISIGVYDNAIKYVSQRKQFGRPISGFQLIQEKLVKIMANTQSILFLCIRLSQLVDQGKASIGQIAMTKAHVTERAREIARWGREVYGGNGIIHSNYAMKALADVEAVYTYEGTYDINVLVAGRELTGLPAFRK